MIETSGLSKVFCHRKRGPFNAVNGVSFRCDPGDIFGLLGVNGAGKTTTLRMLATMLKPTSGSAMVAGFDVCSQPQHVREQIGFLSTATALYGRLTAREMVEYFGRLHGFSPSTLATRVPHIFDQLDMHAFADSRCDNLSTGMKQKVSIARTLVHDPAVLIFDEPTNGLDVFATRAIQETIRACRAGGKTVIYSSHVMNEVEKLCDRIAIMHQGAILTQGTLEELHSRYDGDDLEDLFVGAIEASDQPGAMSL